MNLVESLKSRGLIEHSSAPPEVVFGKPRTAYLGVDPTADSLQIGNLAVILLMKRLGDAGHKLFFLVGGGTGMIGDPREKGERPLLDEAILRKNTKAIKLQLKGILRGVPFKMVDNADWLSKVRLIPFLRDIGKHFTVNDLIKRDLIAKRLSTPDESISYTEFTYALLQGYDYLTLNENFGVDLQVGGSDQWTNILSGVDLIRKKTGKEAFAIGIPLVTDASGKKFGKSEGNAIWLDPKKTSPFQFYQFWMNLPDAGLEKCLQVYTFLSANDIAELLKQHHASPQKRVGQANLARLVTEIVHGSKEALAAELATDALFGPKHFHEVSKEARDAAIAVAPSFKISKRDLTKGFALVDALVAGGLASSKGDARRTIEAKGITLGGLPISNPDQKIYPGDLAAGYALIRKGKREVLILVLK